MIEGVIEKIRSDAKLAKLLIEAKEYEQVYAFAKQRQKGCDSMGNLDQFEAKGVQ